MASSFFFGCRRTLPCFSTGNAPEKSRTHDAMSPVSHPSPDAYECPNDFGDVKSVSDIHTAPDPPDGFTHNTEVEERKVMSPTAVAGEFKQGFVAQQGEHGRRFCAPHQIIGLILGTSLFIIFMIFELDEKYPKANDMLAITSLISCFWAFQVLPLPVTAIIPVVLLPFAEILTTKKVSTAYWGWVQMMFLGAFIVDIALEHVNLHRRGALFFLLRGGHHPSGVVLVFLLIAWIASRFCSNTATTVMLVPPAIGYMDAVRSHLPGNALDVEGGQDPRHDSFRHFSAAVMLAIAYGSSCGGLSALSGTPPNGVLSGLPIVNEQVGYLDWMLFTGPLSIALIVIIYIVLYFVYLRKIDIHLSEKLLREQYEELGPVNRDEICVGIIQTLQFVGFILRQEVINDPELTAPANLKGVNDATIACATALLVFCIPSVRRPGEMLLPWDVAQARLPWGVMLLMGGGGAIAAGFKASNLTKFIGELVGNATNIGRFWLTILTTTMVCFLTEVTSNTATSNIILPVLASVASKSLLHPLGLLLPATVACSFAFMLPSATPPNAVVFSTGLVSISDFIKVGIIINIAASIVGGVLLYWMIDAVYDVSAPFPQWACLPGDCKWVQVPGAVAGTQVEFQACSIFGSGTSCKLQNGTVLEL